MSLEDERDYAVAIGRCYSCRRQFGFHPRKVPSYCVDGKRYPVCASCVETLNQRRRANGLPQFAVETGAYDVGATVVFPITKEQP